MTTLYLTIPQNKAGDEGKKSYVETLKSAVVSGYAVPMRQTMQCVPGSQVVLLCHATRQRAQGKITKMAQTGETTGSGMSGTMFIWKT